MGDNEKKFYVVWAGKETGIFDSWEQCKKNVHKFSGAKYKSFKSLEEAHKALDEGWEKYYKINPNKTKSNNLQKLSESEKFQLIETIPFFSESIAVDAACSENPGKMEYRGVDLQTGKEIFHERFNIGTNNIGEFLAIIHGLKYLGNDNRAIYSDSKIAISRIQHGKCKTKLKNSNDLDLSQILNAIKNAENWLKDNGIKHNILKRNTENRGEIPADFGRK